MIIGLAGCEDLQVEESRKVLLGIATQTMKLDADLVKLQAELKTSDVEMLKDIAAKIESKQKIRGQLLASAASLEKSMNEATNGGDVLAGAVNAAVPFMGPYGPLIALGVTLVGGVLVDQKRRKSKAEAIDMKAKAIAAHHNIDSVIADPSLSGGAGKFDANDEATMARLQDLDRAAGLQDLMAEARK